MRAIDYVKTKGQSLESLLLIRDNPQAQRVMVAWTLYRPRIENRPSDNTEVVERNHPDWQQISHVLWCDRPPVNLVQLAQLADVPESKIERLFFRLRAAGLIWPDGTVSSHAERVIGAESEAYIKDLSYRSSTGRKK